uniref:Uncharacterized protein n=1 Tax=Salmo trutta TaxID=8032 RepID=A0A674E220_SALTR
PVPIDQVVLLPSEGYVWSCRQSIFDEMKKRFSQIENAAEEPRVLCIVQDTTNLYFHCWLPPPSPPSPPANITGVNTAASS